MPWVRLDDTFPDHPKIVQAGPLGGWLQVCGLAYCNRYLTDGFIPTEAAHRLTSFKGIGVTDGGEPGRWAVGEDPDCETIAAVLCSLKIWKKVSGGYRIHDYEKFQPSRADVLAEREKTRKRVEKHRSRNAVTDPVSNTVGNAVSTPFVRAPRTRPLSTSGGSTSREDQQPAHVWQDTDEYTLDMNTLALIPAKPPDFKP